MTNFELTREFVETLKKSINNKDEQSVVNTLADLHPADVAEIFVELEIDEAKYIYFLLDDDKAADVITELPDDERSSFLDSLPSEVIAKRFINNMDSDDATDVIGALDDDRQREVLSHIDDKDAAGDIADLLLFDEDTAGGLMAKELIKVRENWDVTTCLRSIRKQAEDVDEFYYIYVIDDNNELKGTLSPKKILLTNNPDAKVKDLYSDDVISVTTDTSTDEVSNVMDKYGLVALPVVDSINRLVGRITIDDVVDVMREEAGKDYQLASGITADVEASDSVWRLTKARLPWLVIGLFGGIVGSRVIGCYEDYLGKFPSLAFFLPLIGAIGGNAGIQSSAIVVQALASGGSGIESDIKKFFKEFYIALTNAALLSVIIFAYNLISYSDMALTYTVAVSLFSVVIFASLFGTFIPLFLNKIKVDPAVATGPFITTTNDIIGMFIYLTVGTLFYNWIG